MINPLLPVSASPFGQNFKKTLAHLFKEIPYIMIKPREKKTFILWSSLIDKEACSFTVIIAVHLLSRAMSPRKTKIKGKFYTISIHPLHLEVHKNKFTKQCLNEVTSLTLKQNVFPYLLFIITVSAISSALWPAKSKLRNLLSFQESP